MPATSGGLAASSVGPATPSGVLRVGGASHIAGSDPHIASRLNRFVTFTSVFAVAVGVLGLIGLTFRIEILMSVIPGGAIIKPNGAIALLLSGCSLWFLRNRDGQLPHGARKLTGQVSAVLVALLGLLSLSEYVVGWDLGIDELLLRDEDPWAAFGRVRPGLMAPMTALNFFLTGVALLSLDRTIVYGSQRYRPTDFLAFAINMGAIVGLLDCLLESRTSYTHIALQTAITLFLLSFAVAWARTDCGLGRLVASASYGGMLTRWLWPAAIAVPLLIGSVSWMAYSAGILSGWAGIMVMIVSMITLLTASAVWSAERIDRSDTKRQLAEASLYRREQELREAQRLARIGNWWWDPSSDVVTWSEGLYRIAARDPEILPPGLEQHSRFYTAASFARLTAAVERAVQEGTSFALELEMVRADGSLRTVTSYGEAERNASGRVVLVRGTVHDVTEHKKAEDALRESEANLNKAQAIANIGSWHLDVTRNELTWSDEAFRIFGAPVGTPLTYESFLARIHPADKQTVDHAWAAATRGAPYDIEHRITVGETVKWVRERAEVEFDANGRAVRGVGTVQDITERKRSEEEMLRLNRALRALSRCNGALIRATDETAWLGDVCRMIVEDAGYRFCWVGRAEPDDAKTVTAVAQAGFHEGYLADVRVTWADNERGRGPVGTCIRTGQTRIVTNTAVEPSFVPWRAEALKRGYASVIAIPLRVGETVFGALAIYAADTDAFHDEEVVLLTELADDLAFGIGALRTEAERRKAEAEVRALNAELEDRVRARTADLEAAYDREATLGFRIQRMLLLTEPPTDVPGLQLAALTRPSQRVDGDFYDFFRHEDACLDVIVADVMGKGIPAALLAGATKSNVLEALCHLTALSRGGLLPEPKEIVTLAHAAMARHLIDLESFVTLCYARFDMRRRVVDLVDCGHTGVLIVRGRSGACEVLHGDNLPLGIREGEIFDQVAIPFETGDLFVFYSDGITDMENGAGERFGLDRLLACAREKSALETAALVEAICQAAMAFAESNRLSDDLTCVAVRVSAVQEPLVRSDLEIRSDLSELARVRTFVREFCGRTPALLAEDEIADLELAANEAASNIMKHAYHGRGDQRIQLEAEANPGRVSIQLHHLGDSFDPAAVSPPALDGSRESGFGIYLMTRSVDDVRYSRDERGRNCVALVKMARRSVNRTGDAIHL